MVNAESQVERRWVELGPIVDGLRIVRNGLSPGEAVIVGGLQRVRPGSEVTTRTDVIQPAEG